MFHPVNSRVNLPQLEDSILKLWKDNNIFEKSVESRKNGPLFVLYEGPPTANGKPGIHHVLARVFKDVIPRYKTMKGYYAPRQAGWDTHGLPVELEVENTLDFSGKPDIEKYGIAEFNARCRESVFKYLKEWESLTDRIAYWVDMDNAYITMKNEYIETIWWAIKQMWDKELIYRGYRVTPHCPRCGTSLSSHEVALGYKDNTEDPSVYIKFRVVETISDEYLNKSGLQAKLPVFLLAWTTTPWTLPGNTALAVAADAEYSVVEVNNEYLILATYLLEAAGLSDGKIAATMKGKELTGLLYEPLFNPHDFDIPATRMNNKGESSSESAKDLAYPVIAGDFVSMEDGTGIVHIAPAYGEIDYQVGEEKGLYFVHHVDLAGNISGSYPFSDMFVKDSDPHVLENLKERGLLFNSDKIQHTYPFCWRCDSPLLYYAKQTWYIQTTAVKDKLIAGNEEINWYPEHIKYGRFGDWLNNNVDWAFSRERYWGTPLPVWQCESCGKYECIGSVDELRNKPGVAGLIEPLDLHRPFMDDITFNCSSCSGRMKRETEVIDCWFDSGGMPVAQWHYPFEAESLLTDGRFPADYICEAVDQTRGWFYSLHAISTLLFNQPCYRNCICLGHILDANGEKMSKTRGNVVEPWDIINKFGSDALRWYFLTSTAPGNVRRFSSDHVSEVSRRFLMTLWNVYSFFVIYANIDNYTPNNDLSLNTESELDRWIISELNQLIDEVDKALESYNPTDAGRKMEDFVDVLSNWYVRRSRRRFWKSGSDSDKLSAYNTLYTCLVTLSKLMAPFTPFIAEELYQNLVRSVSPDASESIHLTEFPIADLSKIDKQVALDTRLAMKVSSLGRAARSQAGIKVRQPLEKVMVKLKANRDREGLKRSLPQVMEELNIKNLEFIEDTDQFDKEGFIISTEGDCSIVVPTEISPELAKEGMAREIVHRLQTMRRSADFDIADYISAYYQADDYINKVIEDFSKYIKQETLSRQLSSGVPEDVFTDKYKISGHEILLGVKKEAI